MTVTIIALALFRVAQDLVRFGCFLEFLLRLGIAHIPVRMELHGQPPVGALDLLGVCTAADAQDLVIVPFCAGRHCPICSLTSEPVELLRNSAGEALSDAQSRHSSSCKSLYDRCGNIRTTRIYVN